MELITQIGQGRPVGYDADGRTDFPETNVLTLTDHLDEAGWLVCHPKATSSLQIAAPIPTVDPDRRGSTGADAAAMLSGLPQKIDHLGTERVSPADYADWWADRGAAVGQLRDGELAWVAQGDYQDMFREEQQGPGGTSGGPV